MNLLKSLFSGQIFAKSALRICLKCHNLFYFLSGELSCKVEPGHIHPKHRLMDYHTWIVNQLKPEWSVLDVGCGNGALTSDLSKHCRNVTGIDISEKNIEEAKGRAKGNFICADVTKYPINNRFETIILSNVLEHIEDRTAFLKKLTLHSDRFIIRVPMVDRDWITLYKKELGLEYRLDRTHFIEYTLDTFLDELNKAGLELVSYRIKYGELYAVAKKEARL